MSIFLFAVPFFLFALWSFSQPRFTLGAILLSAHLTFIIFFFPAFFGFFGWVDSWLLLAIETLCITLQPYFEFFVPFVFAPMWFGTLLLIVFVGLPYCFYKWVRELTGLQVGEVLKRVWDDGLGAVFAFLICVGLVWVMLAPLASSWP